eukprot:403349024
MLKGQFLGQILDINSYNDEPTSMLNEHIKIVLISTLQQVRDACRFLSCVMTEQNPFYSTGKYKFDVEDSFNYFYSSSKYILEDRISFLLIDLKNNQIIGALLSFDFHHSIKKIQSFELEFGFQMEQYLVSNFNQTDNPRRKGMKMMKQQFYYQTYIQLKTFDSNLLKKHKLLEVSVGAISSEYQKQQLIVKLQAFASIYAHQKYGYQYCVSIQINSHAQSLANRLWRSILRIDYSCKNFTLSNEKIFEDVDIPNNKDVIYQGQVLSLPFTQQAKL